MLLQIFDLQTDRMFRQFLQINLETPHNKQSYSLKRNELIIKETNQNIKFDSMQLQAYISCYSSDDITSKITYEVLTTISKSKSSQSLTVTFNYNLQAKDLILLVSKLFQIKMFQSVKLGHFQVKNGHISDYHTYTQGNSLIDDLDQFDKDINASVKLDRLWKINQFLVYRHLTPQNVQLQMSRTNKKFSKRSNQFFVLEINERIRIVLIIFPRYRDQVLTKEQEKQIDQLYIITKHAQNLKEKNICFNSPLTQIIKNYLQKSQVNFFVSSYPQQDKTLSDVLKLPLRLSHPHQEQIQKILEAYNEDKLAYLQGELERAKKKLKETENIVKYQNQNIRKLTKIYVKSFDSVIPSIQSLKQRGITNVVEHIKWLKQQIKNTQTQIAGEEEELKRLHEDTIKEQKRHLFYLNKIKQHKEEVISRQTSPNVSKHSTGHQNKENVEVTEDLLMFYYHPQKEIAKYREKKEEEMKNKLNASKQKQQFLKIVEDARKKLGKERFQALEQEYYHLIHS